MCVCVCVIHLMVIWRDFESQFISIFFGWGETSNDTEITKE